MNMRKDSVGLFWLSQRSMGERTDDVATRSAADPATQKKAQPFEAALKFHQRRRIWRRCANALGEHQHEFIMPPLFGGSNVYCCFAVEFFVP